MAYIRCDKDCNPVAQQPANKNSTDTFGNTFDNFHVDYKKTDKDNNIIPLAFDPNTEDYVYNQASGPGPKKSVLFQDVTWTRRLSDLSVGVKYQYVQGNLHPAIDYIVKPGDRYSSTDLLEPIYLATEGDDDLWIVDEANDDILVISFSEPVTITPSGSSTGRLLIDETGFNEVVNEVGNPIEV